MRRSEHEQSVTHLECHPALIGGSEELVLFDMPVLAQRVGEDVPAEQEFEQLETAHTGAAVSAGADGVSEEGRARWPTRIKPVISLERRVASEAR